MNHKLDVAFDASSENESLARMIVSSFMAGMNPTLDEIDDVKNAVEYIGEDEILFNSNLCNLSEELIKKFHYELKAGVFEDRANGSAIIQVLRNQIQGIIPISPDASKESRVQAVSFAIEAGNVYLPKDKKITWSFVDQCASFPNGKHDDMVDSMSQALHRLIFTKSYERQMRKIRNTVDFFTPQKKKKSATGRGDKIHVL